MKRDEKWRCLAIFKKICLQEMEKQEMVHIEGGIQLPPLITVINGVY